VLWRVLRQGQKANSFAEASTELRELLGLSISPAHLQRLSGRIGREWKALRDAEVQAFKAKRLPAGPG
jgi:hypothetical protein